MKIADRWTLQGLAGSTAITCAVACGIALAPLDGFFSHVPNVFKLTCDAVAYLEALPASFTTLSERMDPTCYECNEP